MRAAGLLGAGKAGQALFMLVAMALSARTLGVAEFGTLVLIHSFIMATAKTVRFQTWQALVHYGAKAQESNDIPRLHRIIKFSVILDMLTAFAAFGIVWIASGPAISLFGLDPTLSDTIRLYGSAIILMVLNGAPDGILQLFDRFDRIAWQTIIAPFIRFIGSIYLFFTQGTLLEFLFVWYMAEVIAATFLIMMGLITLHEQGLIAGLFQRSKSLFNPEPSIWRYVGGTGLASTLDLSGTYLPVLFVGGVLGPGAAGLYRVAKEFSSVLLKPASKLFGRAIYPDLARLSAQNNNSERRHMIIKTAFLIGSIAICVFLIFVLFGHQMINLSVGTEFTASYITMIWLCGAGVISSAGFALEPLLISAGLIRQTVIARTIATLIFIPLLYLLLLQYDIVGAGIAAFIYTIIMTFSFLIAGKKLLQKT